MHRRKIIVALAVWLAGSALPAEEGGVPDAVRQVLDAEYPGWSVAPVSQKVMNVFSPRPDHPFPNFVTADFDGNQEPDHAVQIALASGDDPEQITMIFLQNGGNFTDTILETRGPDPDISLALKRQRLEFAFSGPDLPEVVYKNVLAVQGGIAGDSFYVYENGSFAEVIDTDSLVDAPAAPKEPS